MKKLLSIIFCSSIAFFSTGNSVYAQTCSGTVSNGQNMVSNGDFSQGYTGWTHDPAYVEFTPCNSCYSVPGRIYAGTDPHVFNPGGFVSMPDHSASSDNSFLMVDGICQLGINLFSQNNIPIEPNTNYFFTVWITSLKTTGDSTGGNGKLNFNINGVDLPYQINAPATAGKWVKYTAAWYSGLTPPATTSISIQNLTTTGCDTKVDFAIDDISFSPGCEFGGPGPNPDLGEDYSICGKSLPFNINPNFNAATAARTDITYRWYKDGVLQTTGLGPSFYNFSVSSAGTYSVCVDSAGNCPKTDILAISNTYSISLGPDITLCNPIVGTLDAGYSGSGVTYQWYMGANAISGATGQTLSVTNPGTYSVFVNDPACGVKSDTITVTTNAAIPNDSTFCPSVRTGVTHLSVTGPGKYKWWSASSGGSVLAIGNTYTTPSLAAPGPHTYYVEDTSTFALNVGPPVAGNGFSNSQGMGAGDSKSLLVFNALTSFRLDSITVLPYNYYCPNAATGNHNTVNIIIYDANGAVVGTSSFDSQCNGQGQPAAPLKVPVGINIPQGNGYQMKLNTGSTQIALYLNSSTFQYPTSYSSVVEYVSNSSTDFNPFYSPNAFPGYFNWKITKGINCQRVPVTASMNCVCTASTPVTSVSVDSATFCAGAIPNITLSVVGGSGDSLVWYSGTCGGTMVGYNYTGADLTIPAPSVPTTYFARWESPLCNSVCKSIVVTPVTMPTVSVAGANQNICSATATLGANSPVTGLGAWSVVSGTGTIVNSSNPSSQVNGLGAGDLVLQWKISNNPCPASSSQVTIHRDTLQAPVITGSTFSPCASTLGASYSTSVNYTGTKYKWTSTGTLAITSAVNSNPVTVDIGTTGGTLTVIDTNGACILSASQNITPVNPPNSAGPVTTQNICNANSVTLAANPPTSPGASGFWKVISGTVTIAAADSTKPNATVTGLAAGDVVLSWTIRNSPCADSSTQVTIHKDILPAPVLSLTGASYDTCASATGVTYATTVDNSPGSVYTWTTSGIPNTLLISSNTNNTVTVDVGTSGGKLIVTETKGVCSLSDTNTITILPAASAAAAGSDQTICSNFSVMQATLPLVGNGKWTVSSGSGIFADDTDPHSAVTGLSNSVNTFRWTVSGCGGPFTDDVNINVGASTMVLGTPVGPTDTLCVGTPRTLSVSVAGGSGHYYYLWLSSDSSFKSLTNHSSVSVSPVGNTTTYYVYAADSVNAGCKSNLDSIKIHAVPRQNLSINNLLTPNDDNLNDKLIIRDLNTLQKLLSGAKLEVFNQWGSKVFQSTDYDNTWGAKDLVDGIYYYHLKTGCGGDVYKGWVQIIR
jgi:hypothetical protein